MRRTLLFFIVVLLYPTSSFGQTYADSLQRALASAMEDTNKVKLLKAMADLLDNTDPGSALAFANEGVELCEKLRWAKYLPELELEIIFGSMKN